MAAISTAHLRIARPTDDIEALLPFYRDGLGFAVLARFHNHQGFDGVLLGCHPDAGAAAGYHLEFTSKAGHRAGRAPSQDNLLVFYLPAPDAFRGAVSRMRDGGFEPVPSFNPYWDGCGETFEDADGYRVVLANMAAPIAQSDA
ncbi:hypothetical protein E4U41_004188 [Claviceps citrina]|nr:hypothetical protein E4U41_004188 [Claviceps citrina]